MRAVTLEDTAVKATRRLKISPLLGVTICALLAANVVTLAHAQSLNLNVVLLVADDLGAKELPYFMKPIDWAAFNANHAVPLRGEPASIDPTLNRFPARTYANRNVTAANPPSAAAGSFFASDPDFKVMAADRIFPDPPLTWPPITSPPPAYSLLTGACVGPGCNTSTDCRSTQITGNASTLCAQAKEDVMQGFGGLKRLVDDGIMFPRFYANSAKCAPTRAALMTGRYPDRVGVTRNGGDLPAGEITIAEFLKQGCSPNDDPVDMLCRTNGAPNRLGGSLIPCPCYLESDCAASLPCYRTGLIGKWHLGDESGKEVWNQGFDEYFGFGGSGRFYWNTSDLNCGPVPHYCSADHETICDANATPDPCVLPLLGTCTPRGLYLGTRRAGNPSKTTNPCVTGIAGDDPSDPGNPDCCEPGSNGSGIGPYAIGKYVKDDLPEPPGGGFIPGKGQDKRASGKRPCSQTGLTKDTDCAYLTRVERDQARNFIVRNAVRQPFFLTVTFHAPHAGFASTARAEDHYRTTVAGEKLHALSPESPTEYWGIIEELDAAVGQILTVLDETGVCERDPSKGCTSNTDCDGVCPSGSDPGQSDCTNECLPMGTCAEDPDQLCFSTTGACTCQPLSSRTLVLFVADHGRKEGGFPYGDPQLRGGKGEIYEGGVRVGLLSRHPNSRPPGQTVHVCSNSLVPCDPNATSGTAQCGAADGTCTARDLASGETLPAAQTKLIASLVDLFPTIAEAAGYPVNADGRIDDIVNSGAEPIDGKSFLWALQDPIFLPPPVEPNERDRHYVYAAYPGQGATAISSEAAAVNDSPSTTIDGVCMYDGHSTSDPARRVTGGSCEQCDTADTASCNSKWCRLSGKRCVNTSDQQTCPSQVTTIDDKATCMATAFAFNPIAVDGGDALYRCRDANEDNECPDQPVQLDCQESVWIKCNKCSAPPQWKLRLKTNGNPADLFDLRTNPEEEELLDCKDVGSFSDEIAGIRTGAGQLDTWRTCWDPPPPNCVNPF